MRPNYPRRMIVAATFVLVGIASYLLLARIGDHDLSWILVIGCSVATTTAIGVVLDDVWPSVAVGLMIGAWVVLLTR
jgi:xanthine/uracil permease